MMNDFPEVRYGSARVLGSFPEGLKDAEVCRLPLIVLVKQQGSGVYFAFVSAQPGVSVAEAPDRELLAIGIVEASTRNVVEHFFLLGDTVRAAALVDIHLRDVRLHAGSARLVEKVAKFLEVAGVQLVHFEVHLDSDGINGRAHLPSFFEQ